jgi:hypothetical protein
MNLKDWSEKFRVKLTRGRQGTENLVLGKYGEIAEGDGVLHLRLLAEPRERDMNKALNIRKRQAGTCGLKPVHVTEHVYESVWSFSPDHAEHSRLAIELVAPKRKRKVIMTDERKAALAGVLAAARAKRAQTLNQDALSA